MIVTIYLISGLGADERIFQNLALGDYSLRFLHWIEPVKGESIAEYAKRLSAQIDTPKPVLIGVSFGGMIAVEMGKFIDCQEIVLISSVQTKDEIPLLYRVFGWFRFHKLIPVILLKWANPWTYWFFGMSTDTEQKMLKAILQDTDEVFLKWAIDAIVRWENEVVLEKVVHFHGAKDRILPIRNIKNADFVIPDGGHLMVFNRADEISKVLNSLFLMVKS